MRRGPGSDQSGAANPAASDWLDGFVGKVAIVTGGSSGIGLATATSLRDRGATVIVGDVNPPPVEGVDGKSFRFERCDVRKEEDLSRLVASAQNFGRLNYLVNSAGISRKYSILDISREEWTEIIDTNLSGTAFAIKHAAAAMDAGSAIVNIGSMSIFSTLSLGTHAYAASKGGVYSMTRSLVYELAPLGIRVNTVVPGVVATKIYDAHDEEWKASSLGRIPLARPAKPEEIADATIFLLSSRANYITGQTLIVDGGLEAVTYSPVYGTPLPGKD